MARAEWCATEVYDAAELFREQCLRQDGSMFTPGAAVWTAEALAMVVQRIDSNAGEGSWIDRLLMQLSDLPAEQVQLGAELTYVMLLPQSDTHAPTKRDHLRRILELMSEPVSVPARLDAAFAGDHAIANFSTAKAWSPKLLQFVGRLAIHLKSLPSAEREAALSDPWRFREVTETVRSSTDRMMANAIKHELFPDTFDYMISPDQRSKLIKAFTEAPGVAERPNDDRQIERLRG